MSAKVDIVSIAGDNVVNASEASGLVQVVGTVDAADAIGQTVMITINGEVRGTAIVAADLSWQANVDFRGTAGTTLVHAEVTDRAGNPGSDTETALVDSDFIRVSTRADGSQGEDDPSFSLGYGGGSVSADGRFVLFEAIHQTLVPEAHSTGVDILLKDVRTGAIRLLTNSAAGFESEGLNGQLSSDGRFAAFATSRGDVVVNLATGVVTPVQTNAAGEPDNRGGVGSSRPDISGDGRYVVFTSAGTNLVPGVDTQNPASPADRVYLKDMQTGEVKLVSFPQIEPTLGFVPHSGLGGGRYVAFQSTIPAGANDTNNTSDIFVRDLATGAITLVSATSSGAAGNGESFEPEISPDGRYVVFASWASNLVDGVSVPPFTPEAYLRDLQTGRTILLSVGLDGVSPIGVVATDGPPNFSFSADGRYVTFVSTGNPFGPGETDVYLRDLQTGAVTVISSGRQGVDTVDAMFGGDLTPDAHYIAFSSLASDLVPGDTNALPDVFLRRLVYDTLTLDPISGDDHIMAAERSAALPVHGNATVIGGTVTVMIDGVQVATTTVGADGKWATTIDATQLSAGRHSFAATVTDAPGFTSSDGAIVTVDDGVVHQNAAPSVTADTLTLPAFSTASGNLLANDSDPDGDAISVTAVAFGATTTPVAGTVTINGAHGRLTLGTDGHYSYLATSVGQDVFSYTATDSQGLSAAATTLTVTTTRVDDVTFGFAFVEAHVVFTENKALLTGPDGITYDVTGVGHLHFTDGTIDERDGSPLVDDLFYYAQYLDVWAAHIDPDTHYATYGWHEGRDPNPFFSTTGYLGVYTDVAAAGLNPLQHYDANGWREGRDPSPSFDTTDYLAHYPDVAATQADPLAHFLTWGMMEGRHPFGDGVWG